MAETFTTEELKALAEAERDGTLEPELLEALRAHRKAQAAPGGAPGGMTLTYPSPAAPAPASSWREAIGRVERMAADPTQPSRGIIPGWAETIARESALPMAGGVAGAALGTPFGPPGIIAGESLGSMGGEGLNQLLGITDPSLTQIGLAGAAPPLTRGALNVGGRALRAGLRRLPGAAPTLHEMAKETMETVPGVARPGRYAPASKDLWEPTVDPEVLWAPLKGLNPKIVVTNLANEVEGALRDATRTLKGTEAGAEMIGRLRAMKADLARYKNDVPFQTLDRARKNIGEWTRSADETKANIGRRLYGKFFEDLDATAAAGGTPQRVRDLLMPAIGATRDQKTAESLARIVRDSYATESGQLTARVRPGPFMDKLRKDPELMKRLTPAQQEEIRSILQSIKGLPAGQPPTGVQHGAGPTVRRMLVGGSIGTAVGGAEGGLYGGMALDVGTRILGEALQSDFGRSLLRKALEANRGELTTRTLVGIAQSMRAATRPGG